MFLRNMLENNVPQTLEELLKMIRKSWSKFVITTRGERYDSQNLPRKWSNLRYYATYNVIEILAHVEKVLRDASTPIDESSDMYKRIMIPPLLWSSNKPHAYGFYTLRDDAVFMYVDSDVVLVMNKDVAFVRDRGYKYKYVNKSTEYNVIVNRVLKVIEQFDRIIGAELRFFKFIR